LSVGVQKPKKDGNTGGFTVTNRPDLDLFILGAYVHGCLVCTSREPVIGFRNLFLLLWEGTAKLNGVHDFLFYFYFKMKGILTTVCSYLACF